MFDVAVDWISVALSVAAVRVLGIVALPLAVFIIGNRLRALGNLLHEAAHRNLHRSARINDTLARLLIAPAVFASLSRYRAGHQQHHLNLGHATADPDYLDSGSSPLDPPWRRFSRTLLRWDPWWQSIGGHVLAAGVPMRQRLAIVAWWTVLGVAIARLWGTPTLLLTLGLLALARATVFHGITTFREMCDHDGLAPGGIFSRTRDVSVRRPWRWIVHPRHNGYHLTHHLAPAVPYHHLPAAHALFMSLGSFRDRAQVCTSYAFGRDSVLARWSVEPRL